MCTHLLRNKIKGITIIEVAFGVSIAGIIIVYVFGAVNLFINSAHEVTKQTQALYFAEDGLELLRYVRDGNWATLSGIPLNTTRYLAVASSTVSVSTTPEVFGDFSRSFTVNNVYRDSSTDDIVASTTGGSVADTNSKYVTMTVSWGAGKQVVLEGMLINIHQ